LSGEPFDRDTIVVVLENSMSPEESKGTNVRFLADEPIESPEQDLLSRLEFVETLARQIIEFSQPESLVIGIHGPWGSGKSSVLNLLARKLGEKAADPIHASPVIVRFNPWNFSTIDQLVVMFFAELGRAIKGRDPSKAASAIGTALEVFGELLAPVASLGGGVGASISFGLIKRAGAALRRTKDKTLHDRKTELNRLLSDYGKRVVVFVDDIDRLEPLNMRLMFRLIRLNADFRNMTYVLAFDRQVAQKVLEADGDVLGHEYLEKIVQVSYDLPAPQSSTITNLLFTLMNRILSDLPPESLDVRRWGNLYHGGMKSFFKTIRDVKRYTNGLRLTFPQVRQEVNPVDFAGLEVIRTFCPEVYRELSTKKRLLTELEPFYAGAPRRDLEAEKNELASVFAASGQQYADAMRGMCRELFPPLARIYENTTYSPDYERTWRREKRLCAEDVFDKYFLLGVPEGEIAESEVLMAIENAGNRETFAGVLRGLAVRGLLRRFLERMQDFTDDFALDDTEHIVGALIDIGDDLPPGRTGIFDLGSDIQVVRVIVRLVRRHDNLIDRAEILKRAIETGVGLYAAVKVVSMLTPDEKEREPVITESSFEELKDIAVRRIVDAAERDYLRDTSNLGYILFRWGQWTSMDRPKEYVSELVSDDEGLLKFLTGLLGESYSLGFGDYVSKRTWKISREAVAAFIDPDDLVPRAERVKQERWESLSPREKSAIDAFLNPTVNHD
jgi:predicted KAP-like P-loop ATPase